ncbi:MAG: RnfABCDGE type electron transport complex subunit G [Chitinivibrionales bacterium]|nr:RnfABCDGE type electron transport complex subunit G [Chitinivibrionales bacterium]
MKDILHLTLALMIIGIASGLAVGITYQKTEGKITQQMQQAQDNAVRAVLPSDTRIEERSGAGELPNRYWVALEDSQPVAYAFEAVSRGYSSEIKMMVGIDTAGVIQGISILQQSETPGLGDRVKEVSSKRYIWTGFGGGEEQAQPWFTEQFEGLDLDERIEIEKGGEWHELDAQQREQMEADNEITAITGATITTEAVVRGLETVVYPYLRALREAEQNENSA